MADIPFESCDISSLTANLASSQRAAGALRGVEVTASVETDCQVWGNEEYLERMVENIISNALFYAGENGNVGINLCQESPVDKGGSPLVRITISDDGPGIAPEAIEHVFERYYRADKGKSTCLGLAIAKYIADIHHGTIDVSSTVGVGTTFTISLPLLESESAGWGRRYCHES